MAHGEIDTLEESKILIRIPPNFFQFPEFKTKYPEIAKSEIAVFEMGGNEQRLIPEKEGYGYTLDLSEFKEIDELYVKVSVKYTIAAGRMLSWVMTHPSRNVTGVVRYPEDLGLNVEVFGFDRKELEEERNRGLYTFHYSSWLLPYSGFAFDFGKKGAG